MRRIRAVLCDWGHTLFDTAGSIDFIVRWSAEAGTPIDPATAARLHGEALVRSRSPEEMAKGRDRSMAIHRPCWTALWSSLDALAPGLADALYQFETSAAGWQPYVDTRSFLEELQRRRVPLIVVSDVPFDLRPIFEHYGLRHLVEQFVLSGEHESTKIEGKLFPLALDLAGCEPGHVLMVGDNPANDGAALLAGIRTLLLPYMPSGTPRGLATVLDFVGQAGN